MVSWYPGVVMESREQKRWQGFFVSLYLSFKFYYFKLVILSTLEHLWTSTD